MKFVIALFTLLTACAPVPRFYLQYGNDFKQSDLEKMIAENPLPAGENIKVITLGQGPAASHHVVQIRDRENPHLHSATTPQPKRKCNFYHEGHEEHEVKKFKNIKSPKPSCPS